MAGAESCSCETACCVLARRPAAAGRLEEAECCVMFLLLRSHS